MDTTMMIRVVAGELFAIVSGHFDSASALAGQVT